MSTRQGRRERAAAARGIGPDHPLRPILNKALDRMDRTQRRYVERQVAAGRWGVVEPGEDPGRLHLVIDYRGDYLGLGEVPLELAEHAAEVCGLAETAG